MPPIKLENRFKDPNVLMDTEQYNALGCFPGLCKVHIYNLLPVKMKSLSYHLQSVLADTGTRRSAGAHPRGGPGGAGPPLGTYPVLDFQGFFR